MTFVDSKPARLAILLGRLQALCDSGFALAVHIRLTRPSLLFTTYDQAWNDYYSEHGFMLVDPVVHFGLTDTGRMTWEEMAAQDSEGVLVKAREFGLHHGWTYALGHSNSKTIAGLTRSDRAHSQAEMDEIEAILDELHVLTEDFADWPPEAQYETRNLL